jgi:minimal PKS acyl carrier protein
MISQKITIEDLKRILHEGAGTDEEVDLGGDIIDTGFDELGYDSLALLETTARVTREYGITFDDNAATTARTPRELLDVINAGTSG